MTRNIQIVIMGVFLCLGSAIHAETSTPSLDQNCLAEAIYNEAGGESLQGQYAVGEIIMNRIRAGIASSACSVVKQHVGKHWQFGFNATGKKSIPFLRRSYFYKVAQQVLDGSDNFSFPPDVLYFNNIPFKSMRYQLYCMIGNQRFYTLRVKKTIDTMKSVPLYGSHEVLLHQNEMAKKEGLSQIHDDKELEHLIKKGELIPIPVFSRLIVDKRLPVNRRFCRPWVAEFLTNISIAYSKQFDKPLIVDSAVRTIKVQMHLLRINRNAAAVAGDAASPHLTGIAIDINKHNFSKEELSWMRDYLTNFELSGVLDVEEEFHQKCFHMSIYKEYSFGSLNLKDLF
jgi:Family of unknown function (DUF5715)/Cell Wall Hydrolase